MLTKQDILSILVKLEDRGIDINAYMKKLLISKDIPVDVLKFIVQNQGIEVTNFYEMLRKKHNQNKSPLYTSILNCENAKQPIITTLVCLLTQITLYSNKLNDKADFLKEVRAEEISRAVNEYFKTGDEAICYFVLNLVKTDLLVIEGLAGRRNIE